MLQLPGPPALSRFRLTKLLDRLTALDSAVLGLEARFFHFADLERALSAAALADIARQWVNQQEVPPAELARQQVAKAKAATAAGASTWRSHPANSAAHRH